MFGFSGKLKRNLTALFILLTVFISATSFSRFYSAGKSSYIELVADINKGQASAIQYSFMEVESLAVTLAECAEDMRRTDKADRELLVEFMKSVICSNERYFGMNICYEPNAFDGKDALYADDELFLNGQVIPYVWRDGEEINAEWSFSGENNDDNWYRDMKEFPRIYTSKPMEYTVGFDEYERDVVTVTSFYPIYNDGGDFIGLSAVDISVDFITNVLMEADKHNGYSVLVDNKGDLVINEELMLATDPDYHSVFEPSELFAIAKDSADDGGSLVRKGNDGNSYVIVQSPIKMCADCENWYYFSVIPLKTVLADFNNSLRLVAVGVLFALIMAAIIVITNLRSKVKSTDELTGLNNRAFLNRVLPRSMRHSKTKKTPLCVMMYDLDYFKKVNDTYGHVVGDKVLQDFAQVLMKSIRGSSSDWCARYGGEEFFMCIMADLEISQKVAERVLKFVRKREVPVTMSDGTQTVIRYTVSGGVKQYDPTIHPSLESLVEDADKNLYSAKNQGRDRVVY